MDINLYKESYGAYVREALGRNKNPDLSLCCAREPQPGSDTAKAEAGEDSNWTYSGEDFDLAAPFSVCFEMPENFKKVTTINGIKISAATYVQEEFSRGRNLYFSITTENSHGLLRGSKVVSHHVTAALEYANWGAENENCFIKSDIEYNVDRVVNGYTFYIKAATISKLSAAVNFSAPL